jgi:hypothetical protein
VVPALMLAAYGVNLAVLPRLRPVSSIKMGIARRSARI